MKKLLLALLFPFTLAHAQQSEISYNFNQFSVNMYKSLKQENQNLFFSPFSINMALRMVWEGSEGRTQKELERVLQFSDKVTSKHVVDFFGSPESGTDQWTHLKVANALWLDKQFDVRVLYQQTLMDKYHSDIYRLNFKDAAGSADTINQWINKKTEGTIPNMLQASDINPQMALIIANAIYFYGEWSHTFDAKKTKTETFYSSAEQKADKDFMHQQRKYRYYENKWYQFVSVPYQGNHTSFCILLPKKMNGLARVERKLKSKRLKTIFSEAKMEELALSFPKFKMETDYDLIPSLQNMGLYKVFSDEAELGGINEALPLKVGNAKHKAFIEVNEEKTEASAATTIGIQLTSLPIDSENPTIFHADHPFIYMIVDNKTNGILFMGRYVQ